ncbi:MAG: PIN domain-containing protein, partial [Polaromonas sp.]|nr:PIN domain-containing protein [Polaromonas sp.]
MTVFVDTNVLLYAQDPRDPGKQASAARWLQWCWRAEAGRLSTHVLNELYANLRRVAPSLHAEQARGVVRRYRGWKCWTVDDASVD